VVIAKCVYIKKYSTFKQNQYNWTAENCELPLDEMFSGLDERACISVPTFNCMCALRHIPYQI
jgi:hypothetical protein